MQVLGCTCSNGHPGASSHIVRLLHRLLCNFVALAVVCLQHRVHTNGPRWHVCGDFMTQFCVPPVADGRTSSLQLHGCTIDAQQTAVCCQDPSAQVDIQHTVIRVSPLSLSTAYVWHLEACFLSESLLRPQVLLRQRSHPVYQHALCEPTHNTTCFVNRPCSLLAWFSSVQAGIQA